MPELDTPDLIGLTAHLMAAYLRGNPMPVSELADFIRSTHAAMVATVAEPSLPSAPQQPAVPIKKSVKPHAIVCLECGKEQKMLKRHLTTTHGLTVEDYKTKWSLPGDYPMTSPEYASTRSDLAKKIGLGRNRTKAEKPEEAQTEPGQKYPPSRWSKPKS